MPTTSDSGWTHKLTALPLLSHLADEDEIHDDEDYALCVEVVQGNAPDGEPGGQVVLST